MCALKYINVDDAIVTKMKPPRWGTKSPKPNHTQPQIHESKSEAPGQGQKASHSTAKIPPCAPHHAPNPNNSTKGSQAKPKSTQSHKTCFFNYNPWWGAMLHFSPPIFPAPRPTPYPTQKACKSKSFKVCAHPHGGFFLKEILVVNYKPTVGHKVFFFHYDHPGPRPHRAHLPPPKPRHKNKENILIFFPGTTSGKKSAFLS